MTDCERCAELERQLARIRRLAAQPVTVADNTAQSQIDALRDRNYRIMRAAAR